MRRLGFIAVALLLGVSAAAAAPVKTMESGIGPVLAGENGMTLYTFKADKAGESTCYDACATNWPPLMAGDGDMAEGAFTIIDRKDGTKQWAKDGMPLYFWIKDEKPGDTTGDKVKDAWDAARP